MATTKKKTSTKKPAEDSPAVDPRAAEAERMDRLRAIAQARLEGREAPEPENFADACWVVKFQLGGSIANKQAMRKARFLFPELWNKASSAEKARPFGVVR